MEHQPITESETSQLYTSHSSLNISLTKQHFTEDGKIEISCTASIGSLSSRTKTGSAVEEGKSTAQVSISNSNNFKFFRGHSLILIGLDKLCFRLQSRISLETFKIKTKNFQENYCSHFIFSRRSQQIQEDV